MKIKLFYLFLAFAMLIPQGILAAGDSALDEQEVEFLRIINEYREANGAPCLTPSPTMNDAATYMSGAMGEQGFFDHNEPPCDDAGDICTGRDPFDRITAFGHDQWTSAAENIAAGNASAEATFEQWRTSPGHNENMLDRSFTSIGIGRVYIENSYFGWYWTNNFSNWVDGTGDCSGEGGSEGETPDSGGEENNTETGDGVTDEGSGIDSDDGVEASCRQTGPTLWMWMLAGVFFLRRKEREPVRVKIS